MLETMYAAPGVGLAAVQVGVPRRLIVLDTAKGEMSAASAGADQPADRRARDGACACTRRAACRSRTCASTSSGRRRVTVQYLDREGKPQELVAEGLLATAIQHEIDHLNGRLIIDFLSRLKRDIIVRRFKKQAKEETA